MDYERIVTKDAIEFMKDHDEIKAAIVDGENDFIEIDGIDRSINESIGGRAYTLSDAAFVIENSDDAESYSGMWEDKEPEDALIMQATYTFENNVRNECENIYRKMKEEYDDTYFDMSPISEDNKMPDEKKIIDEIFNSMGNEYKPEPIIPGTRDELHLLKRWQKRNSDAGMRGGYPLGSSYIDSRCGVGYGMMDQYDYIEFDHMVAKMLPDMAHGYRSTVETRIKELEEKFNAPTAKTNIRIDDTLADGEIVCNRKTKETIWTQRKGETQ